MISELFIEDNPVDISADISNLITFAINDIRDNGDDPANKTFGNRQTAFSKTVILPGTHRNNALFGNIFDTGHSNDYDPALNNVGYNFNASQSARFLMFQDNLQTMKGTVRLLKIVKDKAGLEYEVALTGELTNLTVSLSGKISDLDFSAYDHEFNETNIISSWDNAGGSGYYYPLIDHGNYSPLKHDWDIRTLRPALYAKEYIDKMFADSPYRYDCPLFDTPRFKSLIIPHNQKVLQAKVSRILTATDTTDHTVIDTASGISSNYLPWDTHIAGGFSYSGGVFTYTQTEPLTITITLRIDGKRIAATPGTFTVSIRKNGTDIVSTIINSTPFLVSFGWSTSIVTTLTTGDTLGAFFQYNGVGTSMVITAGLPSSNMVITSNATTFQPIDYGQTVTINDAIPQNIKKIDFFLSIIKLFNLYVYESKFDDQLILITPFVDYYSTDSGNAVDWTYKLNRDAVVTILPMSEANSRTYRFAYKDDSDFYNDLYKKRYNQGYGSYLYDTEFGFTSNESKLEVIFAATPLVGYAGRDKLYSTIFKKSGEAEEQVDSVIRILQSKKITGVTSWEIKNEDTVLISITKYGYAGHLDDPDVPDNDLNFGVLKELFFTLVAGNLTKTQFNIYWSSYLAELTDKDSKLLTGKFYLTPKDIFDLDFSKYVYVDGTLFRLNAIRDYNSTIPTDTAVELLKVINTIY